MRHRYGRRVITLRTHLQVESGQTAEEFIVKGRGMLHLGILVENMRREGFEFQASPPRAAHALFQVLCM